MKKITFFLALLLSAFFTFQSYSQVSFTELTGGSNPFNGITIGQNNQFVSGDFDADGDVDFYSWDGSSASFTFYKNNGSGSFSATTGSGNPFNGFTRKAPAYNTASSVYVQDWDNDGDVDVFNTNYESPGDNRYFQNNNGTFTELMGGSNPFNGITIEQNNEFVPGDFDADGAIDFYSWDGSSANFTFYKNNGSGSFSATTGSGNPFNGFTRKAPAYNGAPSVYVKDWDNDGDADVFNTNYESPGDNRYFQNNNGTFTELTGGSNPFNGITIEQNNQFVSGDFDADGDIDFYSWDGSSLNFTFYKNSGSGSFSATTGSGNPFNGFTRKAPAYITATSVYVQDWDNDGDVDVFNTNYESAGDNRYFQLAGSPPSISSTSPIDGAIGVGVGDNIVLNFSEAVTVLSGNISIRKSSDNSLVESIDVTSGQVTGSGTITITVNPSSDLDEASGYYVLIDKASFKDIDNAIFSGIEDEVTLNFTTGSVPPVFENSTPSSSAIAQTTFTLETDIDEAGTIYYVVVADGASAPTSAQVKAGTDASNATPVANASQVVNSGGFTHDFSITGLTAGTAYDVYVVAEDDEGIPNLQASPIKIDVMTIAGPTVAFDTTSSSGAESVSSANLAVSLSAISSQTVTVGYSVTGGTATGSGTDYTLANGTLTFIAGDTSENITISSIVTDAILESNETVIVTISSPTNATLGTNQIHTYAINNDDAAAVTIANVSGNENDGAITVTATLDNAVQGGFTVDVSTFDGTATTSDSDYGSVTSETLTFTGSVSETQTFTVTPVGDTKLEANETLTISQSNLSATTLSVTITDGATITINNDDFVATVSTDDASSVTSSSVILGGDVIAEGSSSVTERGIVYAITTTNNNPEIGGTGVIQGDNGSGIGIFSEPITGFTASTQYSYAAYATNNQGTSYGTVKTFITSALSIETEILEKSIHVYPNPVDDALYIDVDDNLQVEDVKIYDVSGKLLKTPILISKKINLSDIYSGLYFIKINTKQGSLTKLIVKK